MKLALVGLCCVSACQPAAPAGPRPPPAACAPAIPLLAQQHTRNVTRLYLAPLAGDFTIGAPALATTRPGYVSQPAFAPDGSGLYFTWRPEGSQADIWFHDLRTGAERPITCTSVEEYSAKPVADGLSVIRIAADLTRGLVRIGLDGRDRQVLFPSVTTVGAYTWVDDTTAAMFVPPTPPDTASSLVLGDARTGAVQTVARDVGPTLAMIPGTHDLSYVDQSDEHPRLMRLDVASHVTTMLLPLPDGVDHVTWLPDASFLAGHGTRLVRASLDAPLWRDAGDLTGIEGTLTSMVISPDRQRVALVTTVPPAS